MTRFKLLLSGVMLAGWARAWATQNSSDASLDDSRLYVALFLAFLGMSIGIFAGMKRGFNLFGAAIGGFFLGPFAFLLLFIPALASRTEKRIKCPFCGSLIRPDASVCGHCHRDLKTEIVLPEPTPKPPAPKAKPVPKAKTAVPNVVSTEFAQYSEMARRTIPGAFIRPAIPNAEPKDAKEKVTRCSNPDCNRILPPPYHKCPHCGTLQD